MRQALVEVTNSTSLVGRNVSPGDSPTDNILEALQSLVILQRAKDLRQQKEYDGYLEHFLGYHGRAKSKSSSTIMKGLYAE